MSIFNLYNKNRTILSFWILGLLSLFTRAYVNFSQNLLIGNGGYYPLQVRTVLERGELAFPDMPFLFYLDAGIVKFISLFGFTQSDELILFVVKTVDSISIPLLLIPLYKIVTLTHNKQYSTSIFMTAMFSVLAFYTLTLVSGTQKNSLAITLLFFAIASFMEWLKTQQTRSIILALIFLILVGITHFGTFSFALLLLVIFLIYYYKKRAVIPSIIVVLTSLSLIYFFDPTRSERLLLIWQNLFAGKPRPPQMLMMLVYFAIAIVAFYGYRKYKSNFNHPEKALILTFISLFFVITTPIIDPQVSGRLSVFLFIPIVILILYFGPLITRKWHVAISTVLGLTVSISIGMTFFGNPPADVSKADLDDLKNMKPYIKDPNHTVVISRHNLEFWVAWSLHVDVSQESKFDETLINDYDHILILNQIENKEAERNRPPQPEPESNERNHFDQPLIPENSSLIYTSKQFKLYRFQK
jgi:hypothetical protein